MALKSHGKDSCIGEASFPYNKVLGGKQKRKTKLCVFNGQSGISLPIYGLVPAMDVAFKSSFTIAAMLKSVRWTCPVGESLY